MDTKQTNLGRTQDVLTLLASSSRYAP